MANTTQVPATPLWHRVIGWLGLLAHLPLLVWYGASGLLAPMWAVFVLIVIWIALLLAAIALLRRRPILVPLVPIAATLIWWGALTAGEIWLGWTA